MLTAIPNTFISIKSIVIKTDCSVKFLTSAVGAEYLSLSGAFNGQVDFAILGVGKRYARLKSQSLFLDATEEVIVSSSIASNTGLNLSTYSGEDFTQGVGTIVIEIIYEEISA